MANEEEGAICDECGSRIGPSGCCATRRAGRTREARLVALLRKAQNRLRNQGDVSELTLDLNLIVYDEIELELGGKDFLHDEYCGQTRRLGKGR